MLLFLTWDAGASGSSRSRLGIRLGVFGLLYFLAHKLASLFPDSAQVLNMVMPGAMDGLELAERLLAEKPNLKVIISSGYSAELAQRARPTPEAITFVQKPRLPIELARMVRVCLDRKA